MNPRTNFEEADTETARAYVALFKKSGDKFRMSADPDVGALERAEPILMVDDYEFDQSTISLSVVDDQELFNEIQEDIEDLGLELLKKSRSHQDVEGEEHTLYTLKAYAPEDIDREWNVPHLVVYGWVMPELEEVLDYAFPADVEYADVRNHFVVSGEQLDEDSSTELASEISRSGALPSDVERDTLSSVRTADFI